MPLLEVVVRPNGDLYPCDNTPQRDPTKKIGNIMDSPEEIAKQQIELYRTIVPKKCFACRYDSMNNLLFNSGLDQETASDSKPFI